MNLLVIGGDKRYLTLTEKLKTTYHVKHITTQKELDQVNFNNYDIIILPIPKLTTNNSTFYLDNEINLNKIKTNKNTIIYTGIITDNLKQLFPHNKIISFLDDTYVKKTNDILTVDGIINELKDKEIQKVCILGYGNIGKMLYKRLNDKIVMVGVKDDEDYISLKENAFYTKDENIMKIIFENVDYIINTVPENIINKKHLKNCNTPILDIASYPYGMSDDTSKRYSNYTRFKSIPAKTNPKEAGTVLYKKLLKDIKGGAL